MTIATIALGFVISSLLGFFFHMWKDGGVARLVLYILLGWAGFWGAQALGNTLEWRFLNVGSLLVGLDVAGGLLFLIVGHWLSQVKAEEG